MPEANGEGHDVDDMMTIIHNGQVSIFACIFRVESEVSISSPLSLKRQRGQEKLDWRSFLGKERNEFIIMMAYCYK